MNFEFSNHKELKKIRELIKKIGEKKINKQPKKTINKAKSKNGSSRNLGSYSASAL